MNKKLTLNIDDSVVDFAHSYSKETKQSISFLVEKFLKSLQKDKPEVSLSPKTMELYGILEGQNLPDKKEIRKAFHEKSLG